MYLRVQVNLSDEMVKKVDSYAHGMGVSRSALCSMLIGQGILSYDKSFDLLSNFASDEMKSKVKQKKSDSEK